MNIANYLTDLSTSPLDHLIERLEWLPHQQHWSMAPQHLQTRCLAITITIHTFMELGSESDTCFAQMAKVSTSHEIRMKHVV